MIRCTIAAAAALAVAGMALAKLPPVDEAAKAKAAEAAAKTAWQGKLEIYQLCKAQDRVAAAYRKTAGSKPAAPASAAMPPAATTVAATPVAATPVTAAKPASALAAAPATNPTSASASQGGSTPVTGVATAPPTLPGCADPGPFAYAPPEQKPLETSEAHSPAANATSPPSNRATSAEMAPAKPSTASKP
jgi:hypothetical protein